MPKKYTQIVSVILSSASLQQCSSSSTDNFSNFQTSTLCSCQQSASFFIHRYHSNQGFVYKKERDPKSEKILYNINLHICKKNRMTRENWRVFSYIFSFAWKEMKMLSRQQIFVCQKCDFRFFFFQIRINLNTSKKYAFCWAFENYRCGSNDMKCHFKLHFIRCHISWLNRVQLGLILNSPICKST